MMNFIKNTLNIVISSYKKPLDVESKTTRKEFWTTYIFNTLFLLILNIFQNLLGSIKYFFFDNYILYFLLNTIDNTIKLFTFLLVIYLIPLYLCMNMRRMNDIGKKAYWVFTIIVPFLNFYYFYLLLKPSKK